VKLQNHPTKAASINKNAKNSQQDIPAFNVEGPVSSLPPKKQIPKVSLELKPIHEEDITISKHTLTLTILTAPFEESSPVMKGKTPPETSQLRIVLKIHDPTTNQEELIHVNMREYTLMLEEFCSEISSKVKEVFRPLQLNWWIQYASQIVQVQQIKNKLKLGISKKLLRALVQKLLIPANRESSATGKENHRGKTPETKSLKTSKSTSNLEPSTLPPSHEPRKQTQDVRVSASSKASQKIHAGLPVANLSTALSTTKKDESLTMHLTQTNGLGQTEATESTLPAIDSVVSLKKETSRSVVQGSNLENMFDDSQVVPSPLLTVKNLPPITSVENLHENYPTSDAEDTNELLMDSKETSLLPMEDSTENKFLGLLQEFVEGTNNLRSVGICEQVLDGNEMHLQQQEQQSKAIEDSRNEMEFPFQLNEVSQFSQQSKQPEFPSYISDSQPETEVNDVMGGKSSVYLDDFEVANNGLEKTSEYANSTLIESEIRSKNQEEDVREETSNLNYSNNNSYYEEFADIDEEIGN
jgi:hypothetical protein